MTEVHRLRVRVSAAIASLLLVTAATVAAHWAMPTLVRVGIYSGLPGWSYSTAGEPEGFNIDLVTWLGHELNFIPQYVELTANERQEALSDGEVDIVVANFSITDGRREHIDFAGPYYYDRGGVFAWNNANFYDLKQLKGKTVCVPDGSTHESQLPADYGINVDPQPYIATCFQKLSNVRDETYYISTDQSILETYASYWQLQRFQASPVSDSGQEYGIGLPKGSHELCERISAKLRVYLEQQGRWDKGFDDHLGAVSDRASHRPDPNAIYDCAS